MAPTKTPGFNLGKKAKIVDRQIPGMSCKIKWFN